jgi:hypothetical protein
LAWTLQKNSRQKKIQKIKQNNLYKNKKNNSKKTGKLLSRSADLLNKNFQ